MRKIFTLCVILISSSAIICAQNPLGFSLLKKNQEVELSFQNESNLIVIPILINKKGPFNFILDTGSESGMIFDKWIFGEYDFSKARTVPIYSGEGEKVTELLVADNLKIDMQGVEGERQSMLVFQENDLDIKNALGVEANGVLGSELFNRFIVEVNYEKETIRLYEPGSFKAPKGFKKIDIEVRDLRPFIQIDLKQKGQKKTKVNLLIDTGASSALFLDAQKNEDVVVPEDNIEHTLGSGLTGSIVGKVGRIRKIKVGKFKFRKVITSFPEDWQIQKEVKGQEGNLIRYGTIGSDILSRFTVIYDYFNEVIYLKKNNTYRDDFKFNTVGLRIVAKGEQLDEYFISEIIPGSPAQKEDFRPGDEIIAINGRPVFFYKYSEINTIIRAKPRTKTTIIVRRVGVLIKKVVKHKKLI